ncbi:skin secretory protein xP2-like [Colius striatus]|uniref:skin secretory protein xP2-like n=1 Tax=Colius striatus TaxID=57412 RepID=UPI002B1CFB76|nr:skin secretory protein xP2-like [Colius striatus]
MGHELSLAAAIDGHGITHTRAEGCAKPLKGSAGPCSQAAPTAASCAQGPEGPRQVAGPPASRPRAGRATAATGMGRERPRPGGDLPAGGSALRLPRPQPLRPPPRRRKRGRRKAAPGANATAPPAPGSGPATRPAKAGAEAPHPSPALGLVGRRPSAQVNAYPSAASAPTAGLAALQSPDGNCYGRQQRLAGLWREAR